MKMKKTNLQDQSSWTRSSLTRRESARWQEDYGIHIAGPISNLTRIGLAVLIVCALAATLCAADSTNKTSSTRLTSQGIPNTLDAEAYMRELASRLGSTEGKDLLLRGLSNEAPRPPAAKSAPAKPIQNPAAPTRLTPARPVSPSPVAPSPSPSQPTTTQLDWGQPTEEQLLAAQAAIAQLLASRRAQETAAATAPAPTAQADANSPTTQDPNSTQTQQPALDPATWLSVYNKAAQKGLQDIQAERAAKGDEQWKLSEDLEKYRAYSVREGSRDSGESLKKALERAGLAVNDGVNIFMLGYASDRAKPFRANDGKGLLDKPGAVPQQAGATIGSLGDGLYSMADLLTLNSLPDANNAAYKDNNPVVRPIIFAGRTIGGAWRTTEEIGNAVTWGYFDNVTGCIGMLLEDIIEVLKHTGEAVTNLARLPFHAIGANDENANQAMDWLLVVPLEMASNMVEMKGVANTGDYRTAFAEKGVIGSIVEFGGSSYIVYRVVDEMVDKLKDDHKDHGDKSSSGNSSSSGGSTSPIDNPVDDVPDTDTGLYFWWGEWPGPDA
jgi:hypothetical protein